MRIGCQGGINLIDLIIPYYNNPQGIITTLNSINFNIFNVTIIDDGSNERLPSTLINAQVLRYDINRGPGYARQYGLDHTSNSYVMFLDTGDIFISFEVQEQILEIIKDKPQINFFCFPYYHYDELTDWGDNRMHGKLYKRSFLEKYNITFPPTSSYLNEDIGFNRTCRLCTHMEFISFPIIEQIWDENSITQKDNCISLYKDQTRALSLVSIHTVETLQKNNINPQEEINAIAISLYYWFIRTAVERPKYLQDAWSGAKIFYDHFKNKICPDNLTLGNIYFQKCLQFKDKVAFPINILRFTHEILNNETIPNKYLTYA